MSPSLPWLHCTAASCKQHLQVDCQGGHIAWNPQAISRLKLLQASFSQHHCMPFNACQAGIAASSTISTISNHLRRVFRVLLAAASC
jgi:hypothetical protein